MVVKIKKLVENAVIPKKATELAAGHDVVVTEINQESEDFVICKLGFALTPPKGYKVVLVPRSSLTKTKWVLQNSPGQGDEDYTGEYQFRFRCIPSGFEPGYSNGIIGPGYYSSPSKVIYEPFPYTLGDRIGQMFIEPVIPIEFEEVTELSTTERNTGGYGSTGN
jgi:dUTP pyrophosphatase